MSTAIYEFQRQFAPVESWSVIVNDVLADHARHIDHVRSNIEGMSVFSDKAQEQLNTGKIGIESFLVFEW